MQLSPWSSKWLLTSTTDHWLKTYLESPEDFFFLLKHFKDFFFQVLSNYLVKKLETDPFIYPQSRNCSCRRSRLPCAALGVTPALTCRTTLSRGEWEPGPFPQAETNVLWDCCTVLRDKARPPRKSSLWPQRWKTSTLSLSHWKSSVWFLNI